MSASAWGPIRSWSGASWIPPSRSTGPSGPSGLRSVGRHRLAVSQVHRHNKLGALPRNRTMEPWDVTIVGGGILGTSFAYWLANRYDGRIAGIEKEPQVAAHTPRRNTGVIHRPFHLEPVRRRVFARSFQAAYGMWKAFPAGPRLARSPLGTFAGATRP